MPLSRPSSAEHSRHGIFAIRRWSVALLVAVYLTISLPLLSSARPDWTLRGTKAVQQADRPSLAMLSRFATAARQLGSTMLATRPGKLLAWLQADTITTLGYLSDGVGVLPTAVQIYETYKEKDSENLSMDMFLQRFAGDLVNFAGCLMCNEPIYNKLLSGYYILETIAFAWVAIFFAYFHKHDDPSKHKVRSGPMFSSLWLAASGFFLAGPLLLYALGHHLGMSEPVLINAVGTVCLWASNTLFVFSRVPQMQEVWANRSVKGLNPWSTVFTVIANLLMGTSILMQNLKDHASTATLVSSAGIFVGTYGAVAFDVVYLYMFAVLGGSKTFFPMCCPDEGVFAAPADVNGDYTLLLDDCCDLRTSTVMITELPDDKLEAGAVPTLGKRE